VACIAVVFLLFQKRLVSLQSNVFKISLFRTFLQPLLVMNGVHRSAQSHLSFRAIDASRARAICFRTRKAKKLAAHANCLATLAPPRENWPQKDLEIQVLDDWKKSEYETNILNNVLKILTKLRKEPRREHDNATY